MLILYLALQAVGLGDPVPDADFMRHSMPRPHGGEITMRFFVDPEGRVLECEVLTQRVSEDRAAEYCEDTIGERLGDPATDRLGQPTHGVVTLSVLRTDSSRPLPELPSLESSRVPDIEIFVTEIPGGKERTGFGLMVYIDETGRVQGCRQRPNQDYDLANVACSQATAHTFAVRHGSDGQPVGHVDVINVDFVLEQPPEQ